MSDTIVIEFFTKPGCHLCEDVESLLEVASRHWKMEVRPVNILENRSLYDLYWNRIPVLEFPDGATLEPPITRGRLTAMLRKCETT